MLRFRCLAIVSALVALTHCGPTPGPSIEETLTEIQNDLKELLDFKSSIQQTIGGLARQMMLQQLYVEERIRSDGGSGIKQIRSSQGGTRPYHFTTASTSAINAIHEHSNYNNTIGMGEIIAVLNGLEFRTRHNDYKLVMPSTKSNKYNEVEHVPLPDIPPSVLAKNTIDEQIHEMQQYFKAFHLQDTKIRNYKPYFKPALCYLEGGWTTDTKTLSEPFESDRHFLDAKSWFDMQQKVLYTASTGGKSQFENYSYLPTTIINVTDDGQAVYAQWNYRIVCHPIQQELSLQDLQLVDDLAARMLLNKNFTAHGKSKAARFNIAPHGSYGYEADKEYGHYSDRRFLHGRIDDIMYEIPGKENYNGYLEDVSFGLSKCRVDTKNTTLLNVARYHRHFKVMRTGAMGLTVRNRGFSDPYLFVAKTQNPKIASISAEECVKDHGKENCTMYEARHTYAIPLEIIWMTPLNKWNPYNLTFHQDNKIPQADGRKGGMTPEKAFNGTSSNIYYLTPVEFFSSGETARDPADTAKDGVGVLDQSGTVRRVAASGFRIFTPEIPDVGAVRIRYPIMPFHQEGSSIHKNLVALQDIVMDMKKFSNMFETRPEIKDLDARKPDAHYRTSTTHADPPGAHYHDVYLTQEDILALDHSVVSVYTTIDSGHQHELVLKKDPAHEDLSRLTVMSCDNQPTCWDKHSHYVYLQKE